MRLDKYIANQTHYSRKDVRHLIRQGRILVNGKTCSNNALHIDPSDLVTLDGSVLHQPGHYYLMLNKPTGYICSTHNELYPGVLELIDKPYSSKLHIAGRLDVDTTGLVLLTNDGQWSHRVTSPRYHHDKRYRVTLEHPLEHDAIEHFSQGIQLKGEARKTRPAKLEVLSDHQALLSISEGKYHQVKRMFAAIGNRVISLHREAIGPIVLDDTLNPGEYRELSDSEHQSF